MTCKVKTIPKIKYCIGTLKHKIKITERCKDDFSSTQAGLEFSFKKLAEVKAGIKTISGNITRDGITINDGSSHLFVIRYRDMTQELFIELKGYRYDIIDITNVNEDNKWLEIRAKKVGLIELKGSE